MSLTGPPPVYKLRRNQWVKTRDGRILKAEYLPGDNWPGWWERVPEGVIGGLCLEGRSLRYPSTQSCRLSNITGVYDSKEDAFGYPKAIRVEVET